MPGPDIRPRGASPQVAEHPDAYRAAPLNGTEHDLVLREVRRLLGTLRFGSVTLIVQDGRVIQVETTSKLRLVSPGSARQPGA